VRWAKLVIYVAYLRDVVPKIVKIG